MIQRKGSRLVLNPAPIAARVSKTGLVVFNSFLVFLPPHSSGGISISDCGWSLEPCNEDAKIPVVARILNWRDRQLRIRD
jgi:hypothetical protein